VVVQGTAAPAVVNLASPSLASTVVPALLRLATGDASGLTDLPGGSLLVLSSGPLGGVRDTTASAAPAAVSRLFLSGGDEQTLDELANQVLYGESYLLGSAGSFIDLEPLLQGFHRLLDGLWKTRVQEVPVGEGGDEMQPADQEAAADPFSVTVGTDAMMAVGADSADAAVWETAVAYAPSQATWCTLAANRPLTSGFFALGLLSSVRGPRPVVRGQGQGRRAFFPRGRRLS
jgi:hypothetical protein